MQTSSRLYHCSRCHAQVIICSRCDRGHRYCAGVCGYQARSESLKRAGQKYQATRTGRFNNADRQQRFRARNQQKVTHHGSAQKPLHDLLKARLTQLEKAITSSSLVPMVVCHHCGSVCEPFLRHHFLRSSRFQQALRRRQSFLQSP